MLRYWLSAAAQADVASILARAREQFGEVPRTRYQSLLVAAIRDVALQPDRPGAIDRPEIGTGVRSWHLRLSRARAKVGVVHRPRHFLIYRTESDLLIVGRVLHDAMELAKHVDVMSWR